jgi:hypothetical protein
MFNPAIDSKRGAAT